VIRYWSFTNVLGVCHVDRVR